MHWHDIVCCVGEFPDEPGFHLTVVPPKVECEMTASDYQMMAVARFFDHMPSYLNAEQAHILLCVRDFSKLAVREVFSTWSPSWYVALAPALAAFILTEERLWQYCKNWGEAVFRRGSANPRISRAPILDDLRPFADYVDGCLKMNGHRPWASVSLMR